MVTSEFQFHRERKKEKIENIHVWIKGLSNSERSVWGFGYIDGRKNITIVFGESNILNNDRLHIIPVIEFLEIISGINDKKKSVSIYTDNTYLVNVLKEWSDKWKKNDFKLSDGTDRPNADLLRRVENLRSNITLNMKTLFTKNDFTEKIETLCRTELDRL